MRPDPGQDLLADHTSLFGVDNQIRSHRHVCRPCRSRKAGLRRASVQAGGPSSGLRGFREEIASNRLPPTPAITLATKPANPGGQVDLLADRCDWSAGGLTRTRRACSAGLPRRANLSNAIPHEGVHSGSRSGLSQGPSSGASNGSTDPLTMSIAKAHHGVTVHSGPLLDALALTLDRSTRPTRRHPVRGGYDREPLVVCSYPQCTTATS